MSVIETTLEMPCSARARHLTVPRSILRLVTFLLIMVVTTSPKEILICVSMDGQEIRWLSIIS